MSTVVRNRHLAGTGAPACAVCCAGPVLGLLGLAGTGAAATAAAFLFAGVMFAVGSVPGLACRARTVWSPPCNPTRTSAGFTPRTGGVFVAGSPVWGRVADRYRPDRWDVAGALVCLLGVALIMYAPRGG